MELFYKTGGFLQTGGLVKTTPKNTLCSELNKHQDIKMDKEIIFELPDPKVIAEGLEKRAREALKALEHANEGKYAEISGYRNPYRKV